MGVHNCLSLVLVTALAVRASSLQVQLLVVLPVPGNETMQEVYSCDASTAVFGLQLETNMRFIGCGWPTNPLLACGPLISPNKSCDAPNFALVKRGNCSFAEKAFYAQKLPIYSGGVDGGIVIVINNQPGTIQMAADQHYAEFVNHMYVIMVDEYCGEKFLDNFTAENGYRLYIQVQNSYDLVKYLWPFVAVTGFCFLIMLTAMVVKWIRDKRRQNRRRLSRRNLRKIPTKKYKKGEEPETCPICLDDFENGDKVRILPCKHVYHTKCVDPWLTKNRKVCPVCKRKVLPSRDDSSDSENDVEPSNTNTTESAPLIPRHQRGDAESDEGEQVGNSTFYGVVTPVPNAPPQELSPPSSPEMGPSSSSSAGRRGVANTSPSVVVPGFTSVVVQSRSPPYNRNKDGCDNKGYYSDEPKDHATPAGSDRRTRHKAGLSDIAHSLVDSSDEGGEFGGVPKDGTIHPSTMGTHPPLAPPHKKKKKIKTGKKKRSVAASAPPVLPERMLSVDEGVVNVDVDDVLGHIEDTGNGQDNQQDTFPRV